MVLEELSFGDLTLNLDQAELSCANKTVHHSYKEFADHEAADAISKHDRQQRNPYCQCLGQCSNAVENNVEVYISFLRKKLRFLRTVRVKITTLRRIGYRLEVADTDSF